VSSTRAKKLEIAARERNAIAIIDERGSISCADIAKLLKCTTTEANYVLRRLTAAGTHIRIVTTRRDGCNNRITEYQKSGSRISVGFIKKEPKNGPTLIEQARELIRESGRTEKIDSLWLAALMNITAPQASSILQSMAERFELEVSEKQNIGRGRTRNIYSVIGLMVEPEKRRVKLEQASMLVADALAGWSANQKRFFSLRRYA